MKLAMALLLLAAPLVAQTPTSQNIVVNVVVTLVPTSAAATGSSSSSSSSTGTTPTPVPVTIAPSGSPSAPPASTACVNFYPDAAKAMSDASGSLLKARQLFESALSSGAITQAAFDAGTNTLAGIQLDNADVRDLIRIAGAPSVIAQNVTYVSTEVATVPALVGASGTLHDGLSTLVNSIQTSLGEASYLATTTSCPAVLP